MIILEYAKNLFAKRIPLSLLRGSTLEQNPTRREKFHNTPSACGGDRKF